ncbi:MAG: AbrB/MazE/SpoVT family DNA-binding domain-containing protein [Verrucomicrobia bacterium]|nr:AbrB/MazE/SpoVT family DNA-binding domain-containing protein [Verrucomicrobiota bacterium]MCH8526670.1 AbrB/MazE/SpoVT family DNA-binding domain-containing protein [Kiritimatiellia bacterium]
MITLHAKVTSKGQITLPKQIRDSLAIRAGDHLEFAMGGANTISMRKMRGAGSSAGCAQTLLKPNSPSLTDEQVKRAIRNRIKNKHAPEMTED